MNRASRNMKWNSVGLNMEDVRNLVFKVQEVFWQQIRALSCWVKILLRCVWVRISSAIVFYENVLTAYLYFLLIQEPTCRV